MRAQRDLAFLTAALLGLAVPGAAPADVGLILRQASARPGERMTVWGGCWQRVYLVRDSLGWLHASPHVPRPPRRPPFRALGRTGCTRRMHYVGDYSDGDWSSWSGSLRFRVPHVPPGRYQLVVYCDPCHRGRGGTLVVNNWLWRRSERIRGTALRILPATDGSSSRLSAHESALALAVVTAAGSTFLIVRARGSAR